MMGPRSTFCEPCPVRTRQGMKIEATAVVVVRLDWVRVVSDDSSVPWALILDMRCSFQRSLLETDPSTKFDSRSSFCILKKKN
ncbi:hypothetical protein PanWU01x14_279080 [Parasponia andersonii]|uniref:Uncharacterized protein n=1 Tax=Parasponia andersonii TaxID=3476 RepID=A0A2P5B1W8_PARAD|nr:hypothetical protein PanWU01x14_279080 [Parasponia andersonii]